MIACLLLVLSFKESGRLAGAYGLAVTATMSLTSGLYLVAAICVWRWPMWKALPPVGLFLLFDLSYFGAEPLQDLRRRLDHPGGSGCDHGRLHYLEKGREELKQRLLADRLPLEAFLSDLSRHRLPRCGGRRCS